MRWCTPDVDTLFGFLMSRPPIAAQTPENTLIPPLGFRPLLAGWNDGHPFPWIARAKMPIKNAPPASTKATPARSTISLLLANDRPKESEAAAPLN
jgi:hypothetical protein